MKDETKFPSRLKMAMNMRKMTQSQLCKATGIDKSTLSLYVSGKRHATDYNMYSIAKALRVEITWLMGYSDTADDLGPTPNRDELSRIIQTLNEEDCEKLVKFIHEFLGK